MNSQVLIYLINLIKLGTFVFHFELLISDFLFVGCTFSAYFCNFNCFLIMAFISDRFVYFDCMLNFCLQSNQLAKKNKGDFFFSNCFDPWSFRLAEFNFRTSKTEKTFNCHKQTFNKYFVLNVVKNRLLRKESS